MRKTIAKKLRKEARRQYDTSDLKINTKTGVIRWTGFKRAYRDLKKDYLRP